MVIKNTDEEILVPIKNILENVKIKSKVTGLNKTGYFEFMKLHDNVFYNVKTDDENETTYLEYIINNDFYSFSIVDNIIKTLPYKVIVFHDCNEEEIMIVDKQCQLRSHITNNEINNLAQFFFFYMYSDAILNIYILKR